jgi:hypothetical protein
MGEPGELDDPEQEEEEKWRDQCEFHEARPAVTHIGIFRTHPIPQKPKNTAPDHVIAGGGQRVTQKSRQ